MNPIRPWQQLAFCLCLLTLVVLPTPASAAPKNLALIIGIGQYPVKPLEGPPNDARAMRDVLIRRWGFLPQEVKTLIDSEATRANILKELSRLEHRSKPGDEIVVYFSGHGTSAFDSARHFPLPHSSGALVPVDFQNGKSGAAGLIVGRTDLVPLFKKLEAGKRKVWVIFDTCYSGQAVRSVVLAPNETLPSRWIPALVAPDKEMQQQADLALAAASSAKVPPYPYQAVQFLASAAEAEQAKDIPTRALSRYPTFDNMAHGAMTDALLRVLEGKIPGDLNSDGLLSLNEVQRATAEFMDSRSYGHTALRLPAVAEDHNGLGNQPVLSKPDMAAKPDKSASFTAPALRIWAQYAPAELVKAVAAVPGVKMVGENEGYDLVLQQNGLVLGIKTSSFDFLSGMPVSDIERATTQIRQLAWAHQLRAIAERYRRGALPTEIDPGKAGGNFRIGQTISFVVHPDKAATVVLININADSKISVLYPANAAEAVARPADQAHYIPGKEERQRIKVQEPVGMDLQFHFAFDKIPPGLEQIFGLDGVDPDDSRLRSFLHNLKAMERKFTFSHTNLRTLN